LLGLVCSLAGILSIGIDFGVVSNPEFLREGTAVDDFRHPPKTVIGAFDECTGGQVAQRYEHLDAPLICTSVEIAELIKYVDNTWHALKVTFGNEVGNACKALAIELPVKNPTGR
jgi:GDP-mannose 6-dehydrogenase